MFQLVSNKEKRCSSIREGANDGREGAKEKVSRGGIHSAHAHNSIVSVACVNLERVNMFCMIMMQVSCTCTCTYTRKLYVYVCVLICTYVYVCMHMYAYVCVRMCVLKYMYIRMYACVCVCVCVCACRAKNKVSTCMLVGHFLISI